MIYDKVKGPVSAVRLLDYLLQVPIVTVNKAAETMGVSFPTANSVIQQLVREGILQEITGAARNRLFSYGHYLEMFKMQQSSEDDPEDHGEYADHEVTTH